MEIAAGSINHCFLVLVLALLTACGTSPPVRYFALESSVAAQPQGRDSTVLLGLGPVRMADYLNRSQLVRRGQGSELKVDDFSRWAEPLAVAFLRVVSTDVDMLMPDVTVVAFPWDSAIQSQLDYRLLGYVIRFDADPSGRVVLETQWGITAVQSGETVLPPRRTRYEAQAGSPDDPAAVTSAMNEALAGFSHDIAGEMRAIMQD